MTSTPDPSTPVTHYDRSPAGCVAIAAAQLMYFYHYKTGIPEEAPDFAYCSDRNDAIPYPNIVVSSTLSPSIWDAMEHGPLHLDFGNYYDPSSALIADIGKRLNTSYGNESSSASSSDLQDVFYHYGLSLSYYDSYEPTLLINSLLNGFPVYMAAKGTRTYDFWSFGYVYSAGHAFLVDGYQRFRTKKTKTYRWEEPCSPDPQLLVPDMVVIEYTSPVIHMLRMNWGWMDEHDNELFAVSGDWSLTLDGQDYNFRWKRKMYYGF